MQRSVQGRHRIWRLRAMLVGTVFAHNAIVPFSNEGEGTHGKENHYGAMGL
jgi:hypothetical protein